MFFLNGGGELRCLRRTDSSSYVCGTRRVKRRRWTHVFKKDGQFLLHMWHPSCYSWLKLL